MPRRTAQSLSATQQVGEPKKKEHYNPLLCSKSCKPFLFSHRTSHSSKRIFTVRVCSLVVMYMCGDLGINSKIPNRILTCRLPDTKCINASPRIRLHASIRLKSEKRKIIKSKVANGKRSRQN